ncbi:MAG: NAD(P)H-quinone oxidoreductase [Alphaproteobacteria bacterium]
MTAIAISAPGAADVLKPVEISTPRPGASEVLIKVAAAGVNRPDIMQRMGLYPAPPGAPQTPGLEVAGEVVALGKAVTRHKLGDKVTALVAGGGYAQFCVADQSLALRVPGGMDMVAASGLPETFFTVWSNVFVRGALREGEIFMVHGGTSGIGTTAIQLACAFGARVIATAGSAEKCRACKNLGAWEAIDYNTQDFVAVTKELTDGHGVDLILDMVGGDYIERNFAAAAIEGRITQIAFLRGSQADVDFLGLLVKRLTLVGSTLRPRSVAQKAQIARELEDKVWPLLDAGTVAPVIDKTFALAEAAKAHAHMEAGTHIGKIILTV